MFILILAVVTIILTVLIKRPQKDIIKQTWWIQNYSTT
jgi:hypothetical protein